MEERESITFQERYSGAKATAIVFKVLAYLCIAIGIVTVLYTLARHRRGMSNNAEFVAIAIEVVATALIPSIFFFFAYVLDLLRGIWEEEAGENDE